MPRVCGRLARVPSPSGEDTVPRRARAAPRHRRDRPGPVRVSGDPLARQLSAAGSSANAIRRFARLMRKPSDGLEPSTPSLPSPGSGPWDSPRASDGGHISDTRSLRRPASGWLGSSAVAEITEDTRSRQPFQRRAAFGPPRVHVRGLRRGALGRAWTPHLSRSKARRRPRVQSTNARQDRLPTRASASRHRCYPLRQRAENPKTRCGE